MNKLIILLFVTCIAHTSCKQDTNNNITPSQTQSDTSKPVPPPLPPVNPPTVSFDLKESGTSFGEHINVMATIKITEQDTLKIDSIKISFTANTSHVSFPVGRTITKEAFISSKNYSFKELMYTKSRNTFTILLTFKNKSTMSFNAYIKL